MATTKFKGQPVKVIGEFIKVGAVAPDFELVKTDLSSFSLKELNGKNVILNIFPSLDTGVCAASVRKFNELAAGLPDTVVLAVSKDLPFAHARFCTTEGIENVIPLSDFRCSDFDENYGVRMADGPLSGIIRKSKFPQNPKRSVRFSGKRTKRSVQKRKARNTQKAETKVL